MENTQFVTTREQLKAISDPLRVQILVLLIEKEYTGQQLSEVLELPRSKVHYHLKALEKVGFIQLIREEVKGGTVQKFYRAVALSFLPGAELFPFADEISQANRMALLKILDRVKIRVVNAPSKAFFEEDKFGSSMMQAEVNLTKQQFEKITNKINEVFNEINLMEKENKSNPNARMYYVGSFGFEISDPFFRGK
ncbi:DNA-binding transcriptional ArsR family regulator [Sporosarcina luteola]|nr:DNA-binding transcriptional ArsR family regulator [Sporosarcina luteola]